MAKELTDMLAIVESNAEAVTEGLTDFEKACMTLLEQACKALDASGYRDHSSALSVICGFWLSERYKRIQLEKATIKQNYDPIPKGIIQ